MRRVMSPQERSILYQCTYPIGKVFASNGTYVKCVERPSGLTPVLACSGCFYSDKTCPRSQCSRFGRTDGMNVWFIEISKEEYYESLKDSE